jgi:hypothetical protein
MAVRTAGVGICGRTTSASRMARGRAVAALGMFVFLLAVAPAGAAAPATWLAPVKLSGAEATTPQVAVDAQGDAVSVWERGGTHVIEASSRLAASPSWLPPVTLSNTKEEASLPQVGIDSHGDAVATWLSSGGGEYSLQATVRTGLSGSWQPPTTLKKVGMMEPPGPELAVDPQGDAVVIWANEEKTIEAASRPAGGSFQTPEALSSTGAAQHPARVVLDGAGNATAVWEDDKSGETLITTARKPTGGKWQTPEAISAPGKNANEPRVAVNARGDAVAVWERPDLGGFEVVEAASNPASGGKWGKPVALTNPAVVVEPANQQVAIDGQGDAVVTWSWIDAAKHDIVEAAVGKATTSLWQTPTVLSGPGSVVEETPQVGVNEQGDAVIVWERPNGSNEIVEAATGLAASGSWQAPVPLSVGGQNASEPQVSLDAQGNAVAVWKRFDGTSYVVEAANYEAAGPLQISPPIAGSTPIAKPLSQTLVAPTITGARVSPARFRVSKRATAISARAKAKPKTKAPQGTTFNFTLSEPGELKIALTRSVAGLRSGKRCLAPSTKLRSRHAKRCTRTLTVGTLTRVNEGQGADSLAFSGRIGAKPLTPGKYRAVLTASAGGLTSAAVTLSLTVVR